LSELFIVSVVTPATNRTFMSGSPAIPGNVPRGIIADAAGGTVAGGVGRDVANGGFAGTGRAGAGLVGELPEAVSGSVVPHPANPVTTPIAASAKAISSPR
jgi:hypothetical protein